MPIDVFDPGQIHVPGGRARGAVRGDGYAQQAPRHVRCPRGSRTDAETSSSTAEPAPSNEPTAPIHALEARAERAAGASIDTRAPGDRSVLRRRDAELSGTRPEPPCDPSDAGRRVRAAGVAARQVSTGEPNGAGETERAGRESLATAPIACIMQLHRRRVVRIARSPTAGTTTFVRLERRSPSRQRASSDRMRKTTSSPPRPRSRPLVADRRDATALRTAGAGRRSGPSVSEGSRPTRLP